MKTPSITEHARTARVKILKIRSKNEFYYTPTVFLKQKKKKQKPISIIDKSDAKLHRYHLSETLRIPPRASARNKIFVTRRRLKFLFK